MKFQKKIVLVYTVFSVLITGLFGAVYYTLNVRQYKEREYENIRSLSNVKLQQMEDELTGMESAITYFLSDIEVLDALKSLAAMEEDTYAAVYFDEAAATVRSKISSYYLLEEYYRMVVFNNRGHVIANNNYSKSALNENESYATYPWLTQVSQKGGKNVILGLHRDNWGSRENPRVISVVKEIQGSSMGWVEVQKDKKALDEIIGEEDSMTFLFFTKDGKLVYTSGKNEDAEYYWKKTKNKEDGILELNKEAGEKTFCMKRESARQNLVLLSISDVDIGRRAMLQVLPISLLLLAGALSLSLGYVYLTSRRLTKPIQQLKNVMETTNLDNMMTADLPDRISNDEIEMLYHSYKDVMERLGTSMRKEKQMSLLQLQAQFDLLQAQVNPHFIYNVLNVISGRGVMADDEVICDICSELAGMLRYSTNTKDKYATVRNEITYLEQYLGLLKYRYDYKLSYEIQIEERLYEKILPKIVLQQIVENSVSHGYQNVADVIEIEVTGSEDEEGWYLRIHDSGSGISEEQQNKIMKEFEHVKDKLTRNRENVEMEIGGMGLVNTFARLYLLYNENLVFRIVSKAGAGTDIYIGVSEESDEKNV